VSCAGSAVAGLRSVVTALITNNPHTTTAAQTASTRNPAGAGRVANAKASASTVETSPEPHRMPVARW
jgi:hypothetical protein